MSNIDLTKLVTAEDKAAEELLAARQAAVLSRLDFALALTAGGVITKAEASAWLASGALPTIAQAAIASIENAGERDEAELRLIAATEIQRLNPLISLLQTEAGLTEAQVDALFGIA